MNNGTNDPGCAQDAESNQEENEPKIIIHIAMGMVTLLSVCGVLGNALAIFVFSRQKNKLSSTVFILTLAVTDFISSLVTMPYTVVIELMYYNIGYDFPCKLYQFMKTTTIPFSAFVMVAIALDRYLCIVYPFKHIMTVRRAKIIVCVLVMLAFIIGILASLMIGTYHYPVADTNNCTNGTNDSILTYSGIENDKMPTMTNNISLDISQPEQLINTGLCLPSYLILDRSFMLTYQKIYSALFGVCAVLVIILYCLTYRSVLVHRNKRLNVSNKCCGMLTSTMTDDTHEHTEFTTLHKDDQSPIVNGQERESCMQLQDKFRERCGTNDSSPKAGNRNNVKADSEVQVGPGGVSRAKLKKLRVANIKTALMLSIVAFMYIVAFTPAWMMALKVLHMNVIVYYLYFTYNVANPVIYAFLNNNFRTHLQAMFRCRTS